MKSTYKDLCTTTTLFLALLPWSVTSEGPTQLKLPSYVKTCYRDDPKVAKCIKENIENLMPIFKSGSKEFELQPLDPLKLPLLSLTIKSSIVGGKVDVVSGHINGLSNLKVLDVRPKVTNPKKFELEFDVHFPRINSKSSYTLSGNVVRIPVNIRGNIDAYFEGVDMTYTILGDVKTINGTDYLFLRLFTWDFKGEGLRNAYLANDDVVRGAPTLNALTKNIVNSSWRQLKVHVGPSVIKVSEPMNKDIFSNLFKKYPYDVLLPKTRTSREQ